MIMHIDNSVIEIALIDADLTDCDDVGKMDFTQIESDVYRMCFNHNLRGSIIANFESFEYRVIQGLDNPTEINYVTFIILPILHRLLANDWGGFYWTSLSKSPDGFTVGLNRNQYNGFDHSVYLCQTTTRT